MYVGGSRARKRSLNKELTAQEKENLRLFAKEQLFLGLTVENIAGDASMKFILGEDRPVITASQVREALNV